MRQRGRGRASGAGSGSLGRSSADRQHLDALGLVTGTLLLLPLGLYAFQVFLGQGWVTPRQALLAALLGLAFAAVPPLWLGLAFFIRRRRSGASLLLLL